MTASGHVASGRSFSASRRHGLGCLALTAFSALLILLGGVSDVLAKSQDKKSSTSQSAEAVRKALAEMERLRKLQEQARARALREMEQARNAAQKQQPAQRATNKRAEQNDEKGRRASSSDDDPQGAVVEDDNGAPTDAELRVREIERQRLRDVARALRDQEQTRRKEQVRADRIRERMERTLRQRERELADRLRVPPPAKAPPPIPPAVAASEDEAAAAQEPAKLLDGLRAQASRLGAGRKALAGGPDKERGRPGNERPGQLEAAERKALRDGPASAVGAAPVRLFPGKDAGAEMPSHMYAAARRGELIVSELSPVDLEKAKALGFAIGKPVELKGSGTKVHRLSVPGIGRDEAERALHKALPFLPVTPNHAYTIFMGTLGETEGASALPGLHMRKIGPASTHPCPKNTCFGGQLIKWTGALRSCTKDVRIGIIDTSFDTGHPTLKNLKSIQGEFLNGERPSPYDWHGTAVLSLLAGDPGSGTPGLVPDATFLLATAFRSDVNGNASTDTVRLLAALDWLEQLDVDIVNMSFSGPQDDALARVIERMSKNGVVFIAAAGNMGPTASPSYPAAYPHVIAVTAVNRNGMNYKSANRGSYIDVSAPGVDILTALPDAKQGYRTGTSFAVPFVTAILATKIEDMAPGSAKPAALERLETRDLGPPGRDPIYGAGLAMAPQRCARGQGPIAETAPGLGSWAAQTTLIKAGAALAP